MLKQNLSILGLKELERDLQLLSRAENNQVKRKAVLAGARVIRDEARRRAPKRKGRLKRNIITRAVKGRPDTAGVAVRQQGKKYSSKNAFYWRFVELGTSKQPAIPFMRQSFDTKIDEAAEAAGKELAAGIDKVLMK